MADHFVPEVDPDPAEPRMVIWSTLRCLELQIDQHEELHNSTGVVSWELLKHMLRLAKRHAHEEGNKIGAAERETDEWRTRADEANATLRETEQELQRLRQRHVEVQSEEVAAARAEIETLRKQLANAQQELSEQGLVHGVELQRETADVRQQLDAALADIETLRKQLAAAQRALTRKFQRAVEQLAERKAGTTEPAPVAEPVFCPESERLQAFVAKGWGARDNYKWPDELDAGTIQPTPVAEPLDAEGAK
jgi:uncharacterized membrane protein YccC